MQRPLGQELHDGADRIFAELLGTFGEAVSEHGALPSGGGRVQRLTGKRGGSRRADAGAINANLPQGWAQFTDPLTNQPFYHNEANGVSSVSSAYPRTLDSSFQDSPFS